MAISFIKMCANFQSVTLLNSYDVSSYASKSLRNFIDQSLVENSKLFKNIASDFRRKDNILTMHMRTTVIPLLFA